MKQEFSKAKTIDLDLDVTEQVMAKITAPQKQSKLLKIALGAATALLVVALLISPVQEGELVISDELVAQSYMLRDLQLRAFSPYPTAHVPLSMINYMKGANIPK